MKYLVPVARIAALCHELLSLASVNAGSMQLIHVLCVFRYMS